MDLLRCLVPLITGSVLIAVGVGHATFRLRDYERVVVFQLGRPVDVRGPGLVILIPYLQSGVKFDLTDDLDARTVAAYERRLDRAGDTYTER